MIKRFFNSQTKTITFAAGILSISALISRFLGLIRDGLLAGYFGAGSETDVYFSSFLIPDFVYNFIIVGGLTVAFLPLFAEYYEKDKEKSWEMVSNIFNIFLFFLCLLSLFLFIFAPSLIKIITPGFSQEKMVLAVKLTRLMFLSPILLGLSSIFSSILQYCNRFLIYSLSPVFYNLGIIFGIIFLSPRFGIFGVAMGVVIGAFLHFFIQLPSVSYCGFKYKPVFNLKHRALKEILKLMVPRCFAIGIQQTNLIITTAIASTLIAGSIAIFNFANNLYNIPMGIVGISFALASFPILSKFWAQKEKEEFFKNFSSTLRQIIFLVIPSAVLMFLLRAQLVRVVLGGLNKGKFDWEDTQLTAACLGIFTFGILFSAIYPLLTRAFFALKDTKTPTLVTILSVFLNISLSFYFVQILKNSNLISNFIASVFDLSKIPDISVTGLPLAFSLTAIFQTLLLLWFFYKKVGDFKIKEILSSFEKNLIAAFFTGLLVYLILFLAGKLVNMNTFKGVFLQGFLAGITGILVYVLISFFLKSQELLIIKSAIIKQFKKTN
jgi:putative peptidoglycan lipid II flippase